MFIRRNMSSNVSYQELKQYSCFKQLAKDNDVLLLKQILPMVVKRVPIDIAKQQYNPQKMMYIPQENQYGVKSGTPIDATVKDIKDSAKMKFLMIETKIYNILKYLFFKEIDCFKQFKSFQKLNFFYRSKLEDIPFGGYVYRKQDAIHSIYYLVRGQIKMTKAVDQKQINICSVYQGKFFGMYQFEKNKVKRVLNAQSASNQTIVLSVSLDMVSQLFGREEGQLIQNILSLPSEVIKIEKLKKESQQRINKKSNTKKYIKAFDFHRRLKQFQQNQNVRKDQAAFNKFVQNQSLLFKIRDSSDIRPNSKNQNVKITTNFHKSDSMLRYYNRLNQHRLENLGKKNQKAKLSSNRPLQNSNQLLTERLKKKFNKTKRYFQNKENSFNNNNTNSDSFNFTNRFSANL